MGLFTSYQVHPQTPWNYALDLSSPDEIHLIETSPLSPQPWVNSPAPLVFGVKGRRIPSRQISGNTIDPVPQSPVSLDGDNETLRFIPMGCARLRICCFPLLKD